MFEGKEHASIYQMYRFTPPDEVKNIILQYLDKKVWQIYYEYQWNNKSATFSILKTNPAYVNILRRGSRMCWP